MTEDAERLAQVVESLRKQCMAFVAEYYEPRTGEAIPDAEYVGSNMDDEYIWDRAIIEALGPVELWERYERQEYDTLTEADTAYVIRAVKAMGELVGILKEAADQEENLDPQSPGAAAMFALRQGLKHSEESGTPLNPRNIVATYLFNVRGGLIDATGAFYDWEEDEQ